MSAADSVAGRRPGRESANLGRAPDSSRAQDVDWRPAPDRRLDCGLPETAPLRYPAIRTDRPIFDQFQAMAGVRGEATAVDDGQRALSYSGLLRGALQLGAAIAAAAPQGAPIGIAVQSAAWLPMAVLAALRAGAPFVAVDTRDPVDRQRRILESAGVAVLLTDDPGGQRTGAGCVRLDIAAVLDQPAMEAAGPAPSGVDEPAFILYTSGTTGEPKGLANSQRAILQRAAQYVAACHVCHEDSFLPLGGLATIAGYREMFAALLSGATLHLARPERAGVRGLREIIAQRRPTMIYIVPSLLRVVLSGAAAEDVASVRVLRVGGEEILWSDIELARRALSPAGRVQIGYSCTESTGSQWFVPPDLAADDGPVPVGYMLPGVEFAVAETPGAPPGTGELFIRSPYVALGEWRDGRLHPWPADPAHPGLRIHASGDLVRMDADGLLRFDGRNDRQLKLNGIRFDTAELEQQLLRAEGVEDVGAMLTDGGDLVAFAAVAVEAEAAEGRLRERLRRNLPRGLQPARLHVLDALPRLASGKVDRRALAALDAAAVAAAAARPVAAPAADPIERAVVEAWRALLPKSRCADRRFDEEGGDSLKLLHFVLDLERRLGAQLPLEGFHADMTQAQFVRAASAALQAPPAAPLAPDRPVVFFFPGMYGDVPASARLRARMLPHAAFIDVRYPDLARIVQDAPNVEALARDFAEDIERLQPTGPVHLAGYSFGGVVAAETAAHLIARGREIAFVGLLDPNIALGRSSVRHSLQQAYTRREPFVSRISGRLLQTVANGAARLGRERGLASFLARAPLPAALRAALINRMEAELRMRSLRAWASAGRPALPVHAVLFRSQEPRPSAPADLGWRRIFPSLEILPLAGDHVGCLAEEANLALNTERLAAALARGPISEAA